MFKDWLRSADEWILPPIYQDVPELCGARMSTNKKRTGAGPYLLAGWDLRIVCPNPSPPHPPRSVSPCNIVLPLLFSPSHACIAGPRRNVFASVWSTVINKDYCIVPLPDKGSFLYQYPAEDGYTSSKDSDDDD